METLVVGAGAMGRWLGGVLASEAGASLAFLDSDAAVARNAANHVGGRAVSNADDGALRETDSFDLVCIAVPIAVAPGAISNYGPHARTAIVDVTGTMTGPVTALEELDGRERASFHPLFAPENEPGNVPAVIVEGGETVSAVISALESRDNTVFETTAVEHDRAMETVQARTHAAVLAFALAGEPVHERFQTPVSAALVDIVEGVLGGDPRVYADIQDAFGGAGDVATAAERIAAADSKAFAALYTESNRRWSPNSESGEDPE